MSLTEEKGPRQETAPHLVRRPMETVSFSRRFFLDLLIPDPVVIRVGIQELKVY